jgi:hypothetical protein
MVIGEMPRCASTLVGGDDPARRFAIHARHYNASVARAIVGRFAATVWLVGSEPIIRAAAAFVREHPPTMPCMAEYGVGFPAYLASFAGDALPPYTGQFATLDWHLGRVAIAADAPPVATLAHCDRERIGDVRITLQDGIAYVSTAWSLDELIAFYLADEAPESYALREEATWLEVRGSRGELSMRRLTRGDFVFRQALATGITLADAAALGADADSLFSAPDALIQLLAEGLVTGVRNPESEAHDVCGL